MSNVTCNRIYLAVASPMAFRVVRAFIAPFQSALHPSSEAHLKAKVDALITASGELLSHSFCSGLNFPLDSFQAIILLNSCNVKWGGDLSWMFAGNPSLQNASLSIKLGFFFVWATIRSASSYFRRILIHSDETEFSSKNILASSVPGLGGMIQPILQRWPTANKMVLVCSPDTRYSFDAYPVQLVGSLDLLRHVMTSWHHDIMTSKDSK